MQRYWNLKIKESRNLVMEENGAEGKNEWLESPETKLSASLLYTFYIQPNCNIISHAIKFKINSIQNHIFPDTFWKQ